MMNKFKSMTSKEKAEYIGVIALYPFIILFNYLGKAFKLLGVKKKQIIAGVLSFAMILTIMPVISMTVFADGTTHSVIVNGGENGTLKLNGKAVTGNSATLTVPDGGKLSDTMTAQGYTLEANTGYKIKELEATTKAKIVDIKGGINHTVVLLDNGTVWALGSNGLGQLGDGTITQSNTFVQMKDGENSYITDVKAIATGSYHTVALKGDGTVWGVGRSAYGQLGDGIAAEKTLTFTQMKDDATGKGVTDVKAISAGDNNSTVLKNNGTVLACGANSYGQLSIGTNANNSKAGLREMKYKDTNGKIQPMSSVKAISSGNSFTVVLKEDGTVWSVGSMEFEGADREIDIREPYFAQIKDSTTGKGITDVKEIAAGQYNHAVALKNDGSIWAVGRNDYGQLSIGASGESYSKKAFVQMRNRVGNITNITAISAGNHYTVALEKGGTVLACGTGSYGELGNGTFDRDNSYLSIMKDTNNYSIYGVKLISAGDGHTMVLKNDGTMWACGYNMYGQLGDGTNGTGTNKSLFVKTNTEAFDSTEKASSLSDIIVTSDLTVTPIYEKYTHSVTINGGDNGTLYKGTDKVEGNNVTLAVPDGGKLSDTMTEQGYTVKANDGYELKELETKTNAKVVDIKTGEAHTVALLDNGTVWATGSNSFGQLGDGTITQRTEFVQMKDGENSYITDVKAISAGAFYTVALKGDGTVWAVGSNYFGQLGNGTQDDKKTFVQMKDGTGDTDFITGVTAIVGGGNHTVVLKNDGTVWAVGYNVSGQLGNGTQDNKTTFVQMKDGTGETDFITGITAIACGGNHTVALKKGGTVWAVGSNNDGRLGDGTQVEKTTFVQMKDGTGETDFITGVTAIAVGDNHTVALKNDGTVWAVGYNKIGQLGDGTQDNKTTFVQMKDSTGDTDFITGVTAISASFANTVALKDDGTVWVIGDNTKGQLGDGTQDNKTTFVQMKDGAGETDFITGVTAISSGDSFTVVLKPDGTVWVTGDNGHGQLGDGTTNNKNTLVKSNISMFNEQKSVASFADIIVTRDITVTAKYIKLTTLSLSANPTSVSYGTDVTLTATIGEVDSLLDKTVKFYDGEKLLDSVNTDEDGVASYVVTKPTGGSHSFKAVFETDGINSSAESNVVTYTVSQADQATLGFGSYSATKTYGDTFTLTTTGGSGTGAVTYKSNNESVATVDTNGKVTVISVGEFTITATKAADTDYKVQTATTNTIKASPKALTITGLTATNRDYDGKTNVVLTGGTLSGKIGTDDVTVVMPTAGTIADKNVGNGKAVTVTKPTLSGEKQALYTLSDITGVTVDISPKAVTITGVTANNKTYDGTKTATVKSSGTVSGIISGDTVNVQAGTVTFNIKDTGESVALTATGFTLKDADKDNYVLSAQPTVENAKIEKAPLTVTVEKVIIKNGASIPTLTVNVTGFVNGETQYSVGLIKPTAVVNGNVNTTDTSLTSFNITVSGGNATSNYKFATFPTTTDIEIQEVEVNDYDYWTNTDITKWQKMNLIILPIDQYDLISTDKSDWQSSVTFDTEGANSSATFYLKNSKTGIITKSKTINYKLDKALPDGDITYNTNTVKKFINDVTFGLFFKENIDVEISSTDALSGVEKTEYYMSGSELTIEDLAITNIDWEEYNGKFSITATDKQKFIIYVKVTDKAGNATFFASNGSTFDTVAPSISVTDGKTYCEAVEVTITDDNLEKVTLNGNEVTLTNGKFTVSPANETQTIVATDKAKNSKTVTITVNNGHTPNQDDGDCSTPIYCKYCDGITTAAKSHDFTGEWLNDEDFHWHICTNDGCTVTDTKTAHDWDDGTVITEPTAETEGEKSYTCNVCHETKTEPIEKIDPTIVEGKDSIYTQGNNDGLTFKSDAALSDLQSVLVDGKEIDNSNYTAKEGSTIITLKPSYLETLSIGKHTLDIKSAYGTASTEFTIEAKATDTTNPGDTQAPPTGSNNNLVFLFALLFASGATLTSFGVYKKRKKTNSK